MAKARTEYRVCPLYHGQVHERVFKQFASRQDAHDFGRGWFYDEAGDLTGIGYALVPVQETAPLVMWTPEELRGEWHRLFEYMRNPWGERYPGEFEWVSMCNEEVSRVYAEKTGRSVVDGDGCEFCGTALTDEDDWSRACDECVDTATREA